jgi:hypothetical protein
MDIFGLVTVKGVCSEAHMIVHDIFKVFLAGIS